MTNGSFSVPHCDHGYGCVAAEEDRPHGISSCRHCGKQLELVSGQWFTWEARFLPAEERRPQLEERLAPSKAS